MSAYTIIATLPTRSLAPRPGARRILNLPANTLILGLPFRPLVSVFWRIDDIHDRRLVVDATSLTPCATADKCFIHLYWIQGSDSVARESHQTATELMEHLKRRLLSGQAQLPLKLERRLTWRLRHHEDPFREFSSSFSHWQATG